MTSQTNPSPAGCIAFEGSRRIAAGPLKQVALAVKKVMDRGERAPVLIFDENTSEPIELDLRGTAADVVKRLERRQPAGSAPEPEVRGPGRPKLGVVAREVTLLPRHWEWLNSQPGGASVALRKLVEEARHVNASKDRVRAAQESAYRFLSAIAGNEPGLEEACRALFAADRRSFEKHSAAWPVDVRDHARQLAARVFDSGSDARRKQ